MIDAVKINITDLVRGDQKVRFSHYKDREFWYQHENGFTFPIPLSDVDDASSKPTLLAEDKAMFFMRWMRKYLAELKNTNQNG